MGASTGNMLVDNESTLAAIFRDAPVLPVLGVSWLITPEWRLDVLMPNGHDTVRDGGRAGSLITMIAGVHEQLSLVTQELLIVAFAWIDQHHDILTGKDVLPVGRQLELWIMPVLKAHSNVPQ